MVSGLSHPPHQHLRERPEISLTNSWDFFRGSVFTEEATGARSLRGPDSRRVLPRKSNLAVAVDQSAGLPWVRISEADVRSFAAFRASLGETRLRYLFGGRPCHGDAKVVQIGLTAASRNDAQFEGDDRLSWIGRITNLELNPEFSPVARSLGQFQRGEIFDDQTHRPRCELTRFGPDRKPASAVGGNGEFLSRAPLLFGSCPLLAVGIANHVERADTTVRFCLRNLGRRLVSRLISPRHSQFITPVVECVELKVSIEQWCFEGLRRRGWIEFDFRCKKEIAERLQEVT